MDSIHRMRVSTRGDALRRGLEGMMLLTPKQVSEHLQVSVAQVVKLIRCGSIPAAKIGHRYRVDSSDLDEFLSRSEVCGTERFFSIDEVVKTRDTNSRCSRDLVVGLPAIC